MTGRENRSYLGVSNQQEEEEIMKGYKRLNMVEILCTHV
jgi:hypothetical protein